MHFHAYRQSRGAYKTMGPRTGATYEGMVAYRHECSLAWLYGTLTRAAYLAGPLKNSKENYFNLFTHWAPYMALEE